MPVPEQESVLGASFGPHPREFDHDHDHDGQPGLRLKLGLNDHPDSPQLLHNEPDHDATNPANTTSEVSSQGQGPPQPQAISTESAIALALATAQEQDQEQTMNQKIPTQNPTNLDLKEPKSELKLKLTKKIKAHPTLTPLRKRTYMALLSVPVGRWTTYAALATYLGSSALAVGSAMRLNPFAPGVPCHRVLGSGGTLGGYMGSRPMKSKVKSGSINVDGTGKTGLAGNLGRKRAMLEEEGVRFDESGRARGVAFVEFTCAS